jgi:prepilin-type N-terminal cleavage/methylation domain-containing protein
MRIGLKQEYRAMHRTLHNAFTLVEMLVALLLSGVTLTICATVTVQSARMQRAAEWTVKRDWERIRVFGQIESDVDSVLSTVPIGETLRVGQDGSQLLQVFCLAEVPSENAFRAARVPARVTYFLESGGADSEGEMLVREVVDLTRSLPARRQVIARGLERVSAELLREGDGGGLSKDRAAPTAVRVVCSWRGGPKRHDQRTILLPEAVTGSRRR